MKKLYGTAVAYLTAGLCAGVYYREFTKFNDFTGRTTLAFGHLHLLVLGFFMFMLLMLMQKSFNITEAKHFSKFYLFYNIGVIASAAMLIVKGTLVVLESSFSAGMMAGIAGVAHVIMAVGFVFLMLCVKQQAVDKQESL